MLLWLAVAAGGALGAVLRLSVRLGEQRLILHTGTADWPLPLPLATLAVNLLGSLIIGAVLAMTWQRQGQPHLDAFFVTGLLGGFTTFSAFSKEIVQLAFGGQAMLAAGYAVLGALLPILGAFAGFWLLR